MSWRSGRGGGLTASRAGVASRRAIEANRSGPPEATVDVALSLSDPAIEFTSLVAAVEGRTYRGHDGVRRYFEDLAAVWREWHNEPQEIVEIKPGTVVGEARWRGIGRDSGVAMELRIAGAFELAAGKLVRVSMYPTREEALQALEGSR